LLLRIAACPGGIQDGAGDPRRARPGKGWSDVSGAQETPQHGGRPGGGAALRRAGSVWFPETTAGKDIRACSESTSLRFSPTTG